MKIYCKNYTNNKLAQLKTWSAWERYTGARC